MTFVADKAKNIVAVYSGAVNGDVEDNPLSHLDKIKFHSSLPYMEILQTVTGSITISSSGWSVDPAARFKTLNLFAHGLDYTPQVFGVATNLYDIYGNAIPAVPLAGTVPVITAPPLAWSGLPNPFGYYNYPNVSLVADNTHVKLYCRARYQNADPLAVTLNYSVQVTNVNLDGALTNPPATTDLIYIDANEVTLAGIFSSLSDHVVDTVTGNLIGVINGKTYHDRAESNRDFESFYYANISGVNRIIPFTGWNSIGAPESSMVLPSNFTAAKLMGTI